jgi:tetratricopeptide (TPR) repeat protein
MRGEKLQLLRPLIAMFVCCICLNAAPQVLAEDTIWLRSTGTTQRIYAHQGTIADYTGETLSLESGTRFPAERVMRVDSTWTASKQAGDTALAEHDFAKALTFYQRSLREETRRWVRRMILVRMVECYRDSGKLDVAAAAFLALLKDDPTTRHFDAIPLTWYSASDVRVDATKARGWLGSKDATTRLIGASHLLNSSDRRAALEVLDALSILPDTRIALLAQAQIWRTRIAASKPHEPPQWAAAIAKLPEPLRSGPSFVVAGAFAHHKQPKRAAELYMRVPILHEKQYHLAAQSLWEASRQFAALDRTKDAERALREIVKQYGRSPIAESAEQKLREAGAAENNSP